MKITITFSGLLGIAFIILKLAGVISWSWLWVLSPFWIGIIASAIFFVVKIILEAIIQFLIDRY